MFVIVCGFRHRAHKPTQALLTSSSQINTASLKGGKEKNWVNEKGCVGCSHGKTSGVCCLQWGKMTFSRGGWRYKASAGTWDVLLHLLSCLCYPKPHLGWQWPGSGCLNFVCWVSGLICPAVLPEAGTDLPGWGLGWGQLSALTWVNAGCLWCSFLSGLLTCFPLENEE